MFDNPSYAVDMSVAFQASLLDVGDEIAPGPLGATVRRTALSPGAWLDVRPGWVTGADTLFERLLRTVPWRARRRPMYGPGGGRAPLPCFCDAGQPVPRAP